MNYNLKWGRILVKSSTIDNVNISAGQIKGGYSYYIDFSGSNGLTYMEVG